MNPTWITPEVSSALVSMQWGFLAYFICINVVYLALNFIAFATGSTPLAGMPDVAYGPTRKSSMPLADQSAAPHLPTAHLSKGIQAGSDFWADYGESLGEKFNEWLLK